MHWPYALIVLGCVSGTSRQECEYLSDMAGQFIDFLQFVATFAFIFSIWPIVLRWGSPENPMKSAYLVAQGYANICKMVSMGIIHSEYGDASNCYPYQFLEICIPLCNDPIGLIQVGHLKDIIYCCMPGQVVYTSSNPVAD